VILTTMKKYIHQIIIHNLSFFAVNLTIMLIIISSCNPSYENAPKKLRTELHPLNPPFSSIYHGADFRFPNGQCSEPQCHGSNLTKGNSGGPSCYSCHNDLWSIFTVSHTIPVKGIYHHYVIDNCTSLPDYIANCGISLCHGDGTNLMGSANYKHSCYDCHNPLPPAGHRINKEGAMHHINLGKDPAVYCNIPNCHGNPGRLGPLCSQCH
jgi:hypothetical protein